MDEMRKVTIRLDANGGLLDVDVEGQTRPTDLVEEQDSEPMPSFGDYTIRRNWLTPGF